MKVRSSKLNVAYIECCLLGEQEQSHSAGTDIPVVVYGRWYFIMKVNNIHEKISL